MLHRRAGTNRFTLFLMATTALALQACGGGGSTTPSVQSPVVISNIAPVANAGADQQVLENATVTLSGSGSDSDGTVASWAWSQLSGPTVTLTDGSTAIATFTAPSADTTQSLEFRLQVTDNQGATATDTVIIEVIDGRPVELTAAPDAVTKMPFARFDFTSQDATGFECSLDGGEFANCQSPYTVMPISVGDHQLSIRAIGADGRVGEITRHDWTVSSIFGDHNDAEIDENLIRTTVQPNRVEPNSWRGILRINCDFAHSSYDDPIVFPDQDNAAHLHRFYGNMLLDETSTLESLFTTGQSSCQGDELNRSAYWIPALLAPSYNQQTGARLLDDNGDPAWQVVSAVVGNDDVAHEIFYYSAGVDDLESIQPIPLGLKMIAGNGAAMPGMEQDTSIVRWHCQSWESSDATNPRWSTSIPECQAPDRLRMDVFFPSCWDGVNLDSDDHKSHLAYPITTNDGMTMCPTEHPEPIIRVSFHYAFGVTPDVYDPVTQSSRGWRIASDIYDVNQATPGGMSLHGDWFNAWHPEALQAVLDVCIKGELDCHDGNLANGYRLSGTQPGTQEEPDIVNMGHGMGSMNH